MSGFNIDSNTDIAQREDAGTVVHLRDATGELQFIGEGDAKRPVTITVAGTYSSVYRKADAEQNTKLYSRRRTNLQPEELSKIAARQRLELVAACVLGWHGIVSGATEVPCTKDNVIMLLDRFPWVLQALEAAMQDHAAFFPQS
jgi:hypothetical protein